MDIILRGVSKRFGDKQVLSDLHACFQKGTITVVMGPSGCGKTTLLNLLMGLTAPDEGTVSGVPEAKSAVFQEDRLCPSFSAVSNVRLVCGKSVSDATIASHLEAVGLSGSLRGPVRDLSGGMKRRVAIVRAMLAESDVLFLDEPFRGLDDDSKEVTMKYFKEHRGDRTSIVVTHDLAEADRLGGVLLKMDKRGVAR